MKGTKMSKFNNKQEIKDFCQSHGIKLGFSRTISKNTFKLISESYNHFTITINSENYQTEKQLFSPFVNITVLYQ